MLTIGETQWQAMAADARAAYPAVLASYIQSATGMSPPAARALADHIVSLGHTRGLTLADDHEALADVLARAGPGNEPSWCREITERPGDQKAARLRACMSACHG